MTLLMPKAPYREDLAPGGIGRADWIKASDGVQIRLGYWAGGAKGIIFLAPGRTEYIEKYAQTAVSFLDRGWSVVTLDWRGQGLSARLLPDPMMGHVGRFRDYQKDLQAALDWVQNQGHERGLTGPVMLIAHSMGGLIALRALYGPHPFQAAAFSAPMWGINMPWQRQIMAAILSRTRLPTPLDLRYAPSTTQVSYVLSAEFQDNYLTADPQMWQMMQSHGMAEPRFTLGGPSMHWVREALREARGVMALPAPKLPALTALGGREAIVLAKPIRRRMADWPLGRLEVFAQSHHEIMMEPPQMRARFFDMVDDLFTSAALGGRAMTGG